MPYDQHALIAAADLLEITGAFFTFPKQELALALTEGIYGDHLASIAPSVASAFGAARRNAFTRSLAHLDELRKYDSTDLHATLRKEFSHLFLQSGSGVRIWHYEAPFRFVDEQRCGSPSLFRSPTTLDVEKSFEHAGVKPKNRRKEPVDSMSNECFFSSLLIRDIAELPHEDVEALRTRATQLGSFHHAHLAQWMPSFMQKTQTLAQHEETRAYRAFAEVGIIAFELADKVVARLSAATDNAPVG